jgi:hypothetical protein
VRSRTRVQKLGVSRNSELRRIRVQKLGVSVKNLKLLVSELWYVGVQNFLKPLVSELCYCVAQHSFQTLFSINFPSHQKGGVRTKCAHETKLWIR